MHYLDNSNNTLNFTLLFPSNLTNVLRLSLADKFDINSVYNYYIFSISNINYNLLSAILILIINVFTYFD